MNGIVQLSSLLDTLQAADSSLDRTRLQLLALENALHVMNDEQIEYVLDAVEAEQQSRWDTREAMDLLTQRRVRDAS